jgi:integrase
VPLNWKKIKAFVGKINSKRTVDRPYSHEEIHKLLEHATPRQKVVVLLMASAGLRAGAIPYLKVGHLQKIKEYNLYEIIVYKGADEEYETFCTPECAVAIEAYLNYRRNRLHETITDESPLVVNLTDKEYNYNGRNIGCVTSVEGIKRIVYRLLYDSGIRRLENKKTIAGARYMTATCHSLRKFMQTQLKNAHVDHLHAETLIGHSTGLVGVYTGIEEGELLEAYTKAIPELTINNEERERARAERLEAENAEKNQIITKTMEMYEHMQKQINEIQNEQRNGAR